ncbi:hypothetical protein E4U26_007649 [Claviceps purpurea]|nr:hypothetical protein E4U26_007649 [Claviceps purpurea]
MLSSSGLYSALADAKESTIVPVSSVVHDLVTSSLGSSPRDTLRHSDTASQTSKVYPQCCSSEHFALPKWFFDSGNSTVSKIKVPAGLGLDSSMSSMVSELLALVELRSSSKLKDDGQKHVVFRYRRLGY